MIWYNSNEILYNTNMSPNILFPWTTCPQRPPTKRGMWKKLKYLRTFRAKESNEWREIETREYVYMIFVFEKKSTLPSSTGTRLIFDARWISGRIGWVSNIDYSNIRISNNIWLYIRFNIYRFHVKYILRLLNFGGVRVNTTLE